MTHTSAATYDSDDLRRIFRAQQQYWPQMRNRSADERIRTLKRFRATVIARRHDILAACAADLRKPAVEAGPPEVAFVAAEARQAIKQLKRWMRPRRVATPLTHLGTRAEIRYEPKGIALIISPWNYPFALTLGPLVGAIAAGCCVMIKPSEWTPHSSRLIKELLAEVFDEREVAVIEGDQRAAQALLALPFNHIYFTGSPQVGKIVMAAAAEHLASVTLELGGKSPALVDDTVDLADAAQKIVHGKFYNCGQTCVAPDYVLVHERIHDALAQALRAQIDRFYGATDVEQAQTPSYARIVSERHQQRVQRLYDSAVADGARVIAGGASDPVQRFFAPTVLTNVPPDTPIMHEEIFGPLLPLVPYRTLDEAIAAINARPNPLVLYLFSGSKATTERVLAETTSGSTAINEVLLQFIHPDLPFGGAGESGIGRGHGYYGFLAFLNERPVLTRTHASPIMRLIYPPFGNAARWAVELLMRFL